MPQELRTMTMREVVTDNIKRETDELKSYSRGYLTEAALARACEQDTIADAYLHAAETLETAVQWLSGIPCMVEN